MKNGRIINFALLGSLIVALLGTSCSEEPDPSLTMEFSGCDFAGTTVAYVEMFQGSTQVAYGYGALVGGASTFPLHDVGTDAIWLPTLSVAYTVRGYCFAGSVGDPVPSSGYWRTGNISYTQYQESAYDEIGFLKSYFTEVP